LRSALILLLAPAALAAAPPPSGPPGALYQATAIVTGTDMRSRPSGFAECLREVLVKVSGEPRLARDPRVAALAAHADRLVASFDYVDQLAGIPLHDDQGTYDRPYDLTVRFVPEKIDAALASLGERPWRGERPTIVPVLAVRGPAGRYMLSTETAAGATQRDAFAGVAHDLGMKVRFPTENELAAWGATLDAAPALPAASVPGEAIVVGSMAFDEALPGWVGAWWTRWRGVGYAWTVRGVNYDSAFRDIVQGVIRIASGHGTPD
jgi:hypothetical protein